MFRIDLDTKFKNVMIINNNEIVRILPVIQMETYGIQCCFLIQVNLLKNVLLLFKNHFRYQFKVFTATSGIDYFENLYQFKLVYELLSIKYHARLRLKVILDEIRPVVVYVGVMTVLFLFPVMMLDAKLQNLFKKSFLFILLGFLFILGFLIPVLYKISFRLNESIAIGDNFKNGYELMYSFSDIYVYGQALYFYFGVQFLVLVGIVYLINNYTTQQTVERIFAKIFNKK